ncbi:MAG: cell division protein ZapA [Hyphomicrobiales bacterium]|nr:cell division protein ZapA [Hyphomicrobiales bacterium]
MSQVNVTIAGRTFRMACGDGEEAHLEGLATQVDQKIAELRQSFGEIGDQRLTVMAAIMIADDLAESRRRIAALEASLTELREASMNAEDISSGWIAAVAETLDRTAARIEDVAQGLGGVSRG